MNQNLDPRFLKFIETLKERRDRDADAIVGISGERGVGKSTLAQWIGVLTDPKFSPERNTAFGLKQVNDLVAQLPDGSTLIADEAARALHARNWNKKLQKRFIQKLAEIREKHFIIVAVAPFLTDMDKRLREQFVFWIYIPKRGYAFVFARDLTPFECDPWRLSESLEIVRKKYRSVRQPIEHLMSALREVPTYVMEFRFPDLPEPHKSQYAKLRREAKLRFLQDEEEEEDEGTRMWYLRLSAALKLVSQLAGVKIAEVYDLLKLNYPHLVEHLQKSAWANTLSRWIKAAMCK